MITLQELTNGDGREAAGRAALTVSALIRTARLALENTTSGENPIHSAATVLDLAEAISEFLEGGVDGLQREAKRGPYAETEAAAKGA